MSYLFTEINHFPNAANAAAGASFAGKNKGVILTNSTAVGLSAGLIVYRANGTTFQNIVCVPASTTEIFHVRVWGVSFAAGLTGGVLA